MNPALHCPFCSLPDDRVLAQDAHGKVIRDAYPVSPGHTLVIPHRHVGSFFDLSAEERVSLLALLDKARESIEAEHRPDGYNIGINDGPTAGQTVPHLHIHLIPRYAGDRTDPRGGVRWIFPDKADYWTARAQAAPGT
jgi:diadenosine tetraphosphate (Ap4A) HIT family hydrolase